MRGAMPLLVTTVLVLGGFVLAVWVEYWRGHLRYGKSIEDVAILIFVPVFYFFAFEVINMPCVQRVPQTFLLFRSILRSRYRHPCDWGSRRCKYRCGMPRVYLCCIGNPAVGSIKSAAEMLQLGCG